jgi:integrase
MQDAETFIAAIHRDWGDAQGNYDEFRFFTGLRPSEQIALVVSDLDLVNGIISVNKARVAGVERCQTKTGEDRRVALCPRASAILKRQLALRNRLWAAGLMRHDHVFFRETGEPFWNLQIQGKRWRKTLTSLKLRYRRPYTARHSSVSWNLMAGKNPLWVAKQHGHSICTMLRVYAAWADDAVDSEVDAIKRSMSPHARLSSTARCRCSAAHRLPCSRRTHPLMECLDRMRESSANTNLAVDLALQAGAKTQVLDNRWERLAEREGFEPSKGF